MQILSHLTLLSVFVPAITQSFLDIIFSAISFDVYDVGSYIRSIFFIDTEEDYNVEQEDKMVQLGYESGHMPINFGTFLFVIFVQIAITIILFVMLNFCCIDKCKKWAQKKMNAIVFNSLLAFIDGTFLLIVMGAAINIKLVSDGQLSANFSFYVSIFGLTICILELISTAIFLKVNIATLGEQRRINRCGYLYEGLNYVIRGGMALTYPILYQLRLLLLVYTIIYAKSCMVLQALLVTLSSIFIAFVLGTAHPFEQIS